MRRARVGRRAPRSHARATAATVGSAVGIAAVLLLVLTPAARGLQSGNRWKASTELSFVRTGGNAESSTLGIGSTLTRIWERTEVKVEAGGIRTRTTHLTRTAVGTAENFRVDERSESALSAENYRARLRVDRRVSDRTSFFVQSGWTRNTFAGVLNRLVNVAGVSTRWTESERQSLRTAYGLTHTVEQDEVPDPESASRFVGLRVSSEYQLEVTDNTDWGSGLVIDGNGDDPSDLRADWTNSLSVAMNEHLGLKTSFRATFDNQPALASVPLLSSMGEAAGEVVVPREKVDHVFTVALVVSF